MAVRRPTAPKRLGGNVKSRNPLLTTEPNVKTARAASRIERALSTESLAESTPLGPGGHFQSPEFSEPAPEEPYDWVNLQSSRIRRAAYDKGTKVIAVQFVDGTPWHYADVNGEIWKRLQRSKSPGRFVDRVLNGFPYGHGYH